MRRFRFFLFLTLLLSALAAQTASGQGRGRLNGGISVGSAQFQVASPEHLKINGGTFFALQVEKSIGAMPLYVEGAINYMRATGSANYLYNSATSGYSATNSSLLLDDVHMSLGLRYKLFEEFPIRPYLEVGAAGGYFQLTYDDSIKTPAFNAAGDMKTVDGGLEVGFYGEAGAEVNFTGGFGTRLAYRYFDSSTRPMETLNKTIVRYAANIFSLSLFWHFW